MQHKIFSPNDLWTFHATGNPFAFFAPIHYELLSPVALIGVKPEYHFMVVAQTFPNHTIIYDGPDMVEAQDVHKRYNDGKEYCTSYIRKCCPTLPKNSFHLIQPRNTRQIFVAPGEDKSKRCLLFGECGSPLLNRPRIMREETSGRILQMTRENAPTLFVALLDIGKRVVFEGTAKNPAGHFCVEEFVWDGTEIQREIVKRYDWEIRTHGIAVVDGMADLEKIARL